MRTTKSLTVGLILALLLGAGTVFADVSPLSGLTAEWWQVMSSIPTPVNPGLDQTGADCMVGQRGPVWFLAGNFFTGATTTIRTCSVPEGEWLFFPVVNIVNYNSPNLCGQTGSLGVDMLRSQIAPLIDAAADLSVKVDGQPVNMVRVKSLPFAITVPADSVLSAQCIAQGNGTLPAGI